MTQSQQCVKINVITNYDCSETCISITLHLQGKMEGSRVDKKKTRWKRTQLSVSFTYVVPCHALCHLLDNSVPTSNNVRLPFLV